MEKDQLDPRDEPSPDPAGPKARLVLFGRRIPMPRTRLGRTLLGSFMLLLGLLGFLPVLGFWMVPLGLLILAYDFAAIRRFNRRSGVWIRRRIQKR